MVVYRAKRNADSTYEGNVMFGGQEVIIPILGGEEISEFC